MHPSYKRTKAKVRIEAVIKITERCNINCTYCYMFNRGNDDYLEHPIYISDEVILATAKFLAQGAKDLETKEVRIIFHGGEPMMFKKARFIWMCDILLQEITPFAKVVFAMQTNGMLVSDAWLDILSKYKIGVGVSIDGTAEAHDQLRVDHQGKGTYSRAIAGLKTLQKAYLEGKISRPGGLCVINPTQDAKAIYHHLVNELGITKQNFLLPMETHDSVSREYVERLGQFLCDMFDEWIAADNPQIDIRIISQYLSFLINGKDVVTALEEFRKEGMFLFTIASNGQLGPDDDLKPTNVTIENKNVLTDSLIDFINSPSLEYLQDVEFLMPDECKTCCWQNYCRGGSQNGSMVNRFSHKNGFNNPSVFCEGLKMYYGHVTAYALKHGTPTSIITQVLDYTNSVYHKEITPIPPNLLRKNIPILQIAS
jgi:uncharacterized protein